MRNGPSKGGCDEEAPSLPALVMVLFVLPADKQLQLWKLTCAPRWAVSRDGEKY